MGGASPEQSLRAPKQDKFQKNRNNDDAKRRGLSRSHREVAGQEVRSAQIPHTTKLPHIAPLLLPLPPRTSITQIKKVP